jgi:hypothetical protein
MKVAPAHHAWPILVGLGLTLPFLVLELVNRRPYQEDFPFPLFGLLWLLSAAFMVLLRPLVYPIGRRTMPNILHRMLRLMLLIVIAGVWSGIVRDQMPCFLGVRFCD